MTVSSGNPPHDLQVVIDFVNTRDIESGTDAITTPQQLSDWLRKHGLGGGGGGMLGPSDLGAALELREALRATALAHNGGTAAPEAVDALERAARRGELSLCFQTDGGIEVTPRAEGFDGVLAELLVPVARASADGTWERVKACRGEDCLWAFYDSSRNRSGRWCDMAVCGNRTKVRTYRSRRSPATGAKNRP